MGKFVQDLIKEVLVDKCFTDGMGSYFYVREINEDGTTYCLSLDCDEIRVNQELELKIKEIIILSAFFQKVVSLSFQFAYITLIESIKKRII